MLCDAEKCTACASCIDACPKGCVQFTYDASGHTVPVADAQRCVQCGLCEKACPVLHPPRKQSILFPQVYCACSTDDDLVHRAASGGIATEITRYFIREKRGYACGVRNDGDFIPAFVLLDAESDYTAISGSRYVHSRADGIYAKVRDCLQKGSEVFFCGLPCQVAALYAFLGTEYDTLYTADIVCHGCTEERVYKSYVDFLRRSRGQADPIVGIDYACKDRGWSVLIQKLMRISYASGEQQYRWSQQDPYLSLFMDCAIYKPACYTCGFSRLPRQGDLTLGDFFGIGTMRKIKNLHADGGSMVMVNTVKGQELLRQISPRLRMEKRDVREAVYFNLNLWRPSRKGALHDALAREMGDPDWAKISEKYFNNPSEKRKRSVRKAVKTVAGDRNTARLMLLTYKLNGTAAKADEALNKLRNELENSAENI